MRDIFLCDVGFVCGVENNHRSVCICIVHPFLQLCLGQCCTGRVVRRADINKIRLAVSGDLLRLSGSGQIRRKAVLLGAGHVNHIAPAAGRSVIFTGSSRHDIAVHIDRIDRIADSDHVVLFKNLLNVSGIRFCTVGDKNLIVCNVAAACTVIVLRDGCAKEVIAKIRCIAAEGCSACLLVHCLVQSLNHRRRKRLCDIADSHADQLCIRMLVLVSSGLLRHGAEQIASR